MWGLFFPYSGVSELPGSHIQWAAQTESRHDMGSECLYRNDNIFSRMPPITKLILVYYIDKDVDTSFKKMTFVCFVYNFSFSKYCTSNSYVRCIHSYSSNVFFSFFTTYYFTTFFFYSSNVTAGFLKWMAESGIYIGCFLKWRSALIFVSAWT